MIISQQSSKLLKQPGVTGVDLMKRVEYAGRTCWQSRDRITDDSYKTFIRGLIERGHGSPLEFADLTFEVVTSRAVMAEMTRHRLASFQVESQRYVNANKTGEITFIVPEWNNSKPCKLKMLWKDEMESIERTYQEMLKEGLTPQEAREVLPNSTACSMIVKANLREWRHFFSLRCGAAAYPQMQSLARGMLAQACNYMPDVFVDLNNEFNPKPHD